MRCSKWTSFVSFGVSTVVLFFLSYIGNEDSATLKYFPSVTYHSDTNNTDITQRCMQVLPDKRLSRTNWFRLFYHKDKETGKGIVWCKVPKAGSTSLTRLFLELAGVKSYKTLENVHEIIRSVYPRLPVKTMQEKMKDSFKFMVVRDPFERILSAYRDKLENYHKFLVRRNGLTYNIYGKYLMDNSPVYNSTKGPSWKQFVEYLIKTPVEKYNEHWMPISQLCSPCGVHFDAIIRLENVSQEIQLPLKSAGIQVPLEWTHETEEGTLGKIEYFRQLTVEEVERLYEIYKADFILFGYSPLKYFELATPN